MKSVFEKKKKSPLVLQLYCTVTLLRLRAATPSAHAEAPCLFPELFCS